VFQLSAAEDIRAYIKNLEADTGYHISHISVSLITRDPGSISIVRIA
jgi:hypothetical protein